LHYFALRSLLVIWRARVCVDEAALVKRARQGDTAAYERLAFRHARAVRAVARSMGLDCEDVLQETLLRAYTRLRTLRDPARFREWLLGIARNISRDEEKRRARAKKTPPQPTTRADPPDERIDALRRAVDRLPENYRIVIEMRHFEQLGYDEIARRLRLTRNGVNARLSRARAMLKKQLRGNSELFT